MLGFRNMQEKLEKYNPFNFFFRLAFGVKETAELKYYSFGNGHNIVGKSQLITAVQLRMSGTNTNWAIV